MHSIIRIDRNLITQSFSWNWQHLELKHEERENIKLSKIQTLSKFDKVKEIMFQITGLRKNHQDMGQFKEFLEVRGCPGVFNILFGFT